MSKLGEILTRQGLIRPDQLQAALSEAAKTKARLGSVIVNTGILKDSQILRALEKQYGIPGVDLSQIEIESSALSLVPREFCDKNNVIPVSKAGTTLVVAFADPANIEIRDQIRFLTKCKVQPVLATDVSIAAAIEKFYGAFKQNEQQFNEDETLGGDDVGDIDMKSTSTEVSEEADSKIGSAPIVKFVNGILIEAMRRRASDIHLEPYEKNFRVRFRIDGSLLEVAAPAASSGPAIAARIKIMSKMDIAEKRRPQDGRLKINIAKENKEMDFRVNTVPTMWGEKVVMRLLDKSNLQLDMTKLGFEEDDLKLFKNCVNLPQGMVLITGPTGSGKTTTIYSALSELNKSDVNISTAEDPIEFNLEGINQVQMNPDIDLNFSSALRAFLRQDPDIIMVGEIRDLETAEIAFKAASTGHLVLSTLHTNDAPSTVVRLTEMGVAPYLISSTVNLIVAQRLVGKICDQCKEPIQVPETTLLNLGVSKADIPRFQLMRGRGCSNCNNTGIRGRLAIYELMPVTGQIKDAILRNASAAELRKLTKDLGFRTLRRSGLLKLARGQTTIDEVLNTSVRDD
ncbi:type IV-A pilus assembly ATPase PilB [Pseudobdellovibrio sp. HCB154]|uniref:type IV-A pilus assembly ATPase PilB n=1 Tax=Pseudobdellovibrio sp. HCB154 TaxID=3386277 RepID=UPI0039173366